MQPILTPAEMAAVDAAASVPIEELIDRAGRAVAREALDMLGGAYGRVVRVIAGKGNNGNDGRVAAEVLRRRGVQVDVIDAAEPPAELAPADLVIDAAYGTGFRGSWSPPDVQGAPVLAVDVPSGLDALDGTLSGRALVADRTVTFHAVKPGLLFGAGPRLAGQLSVADIGLDHQLDSTSTHCHLVERTDVASWWSQRALDAHKWQGAVRVVAGSAGMTGAGALCANAAARAGSGLVKSSAVGQRAGPRAEVMEQPLTGDDWSTGVLADIERFGALALGPGIGRDSRTLACVRVVIADASIPMVIDGDGLFALADADACELIGQRDAATVLTPHDGEYRYLTGAPPGADRIAAARSLAADLGCVVLLKGPTTVIAEPGGDVLLVDHGDQRLATAGSGDVLTGIIAAALAAGLRPQRAAAAAAWLHAEAGAVQQPWGLLAGDLVDALPRALAGLRSRDGAGDGDGDGMEVMTR
jgi:hydroxyethylthiazole kinase-like uncharacterized protein yjeF